MDVLQGGLGADSRETVFCSATVDSGPGTRVSSGPGRTRNAVRRHPLLKPVAHTPPAPAQGTAVAPGDRLRPTAGRGDGVGA